MDLHHENGMKTDKRKQNKLTLKVLDKDQVLVGMIMDRKNMKNFIRIYIASGQYHTQYDDNTTNPFNTI